jgi:hypothetical protein
MSKRSIIIPGACRDGVR